MRAGIAIFEAGRKRSRRAKAIRAFVLCGIVALAAFFGRGLTAAPYIVDENAVDFGRLNQLALPATCGLNQTACGPVATVNSFIYLQKTYPNIYGTSLVPAGQEAAVAALLAGPGFMGCCNQNGGTTVEGLLNGKRTYIEGNSIVTGRKPRVTQYESQTTALTNGDPLRPTRAPTFDFVLRQLNPPNGPPRNPTKGEDVEMLVGMYAKSRTGTIIGRVTGHWLTVTGVSYDDLNNNNRFDDGDTPLSISFIDPLGNTCLALPQPCPPLPINGALATTDLLRTFNLNGISFLDITDYFTAASDLWGLAPPAGFGLNAANTEVLVEAFVSESPIPEPGTLALIATQVAGFFLLRRGCARRMWRPTA